jgi:hypothetical protein
MVKYYVGRRVSNKAIVDVKDKELTDEELDSMSDPFTLDNIFVHFARSGFQLLRGNSILKFIPTKRISLVANMSMVSKFINQITLS